MVWCGYLKRQDNKKNKRYTIYSYSSSAQRLNCLSFMDKVGFKCFPERITPIFKFFDRNQKHMIDSNHSDNHRDISINLMKTGIGQSKYLNLTLFHVVWSVPAKVFLTVAFSIPSKSLLLKFLKGKQFHLGGVSRPKIEPRLKMLE